ncbi:hypothetical protein A2U01_0098886, partial [Trifolium medium]|nr:hypothetical protein [Trifolium medium]
ADVRKSLPTAPKDLPPAVFHSRTTVQSTAMTTKESSYYR